MEETCPGPPATWTFGKLSLDDSAHRKHQGAFFQADDDHDDDDDGDDGGDDDDDDDDGDVYRCKNKLPTKRNKVICLTTALIFWDVPCLQLYTIQNLVDSWLQKLNS